MVHSPDGDTNFLDIVDGVSKRDSFALYTFIICIDYVILTSMVSHKKDNKQTISYGNYDRCRLCR